MVCPKMVNKWTGKPSCCATVAQFAAVSLAHRARRSLVLSGGGEAQRSFDVRSSKIIQRYPKIRGLTRDFRGIYGYLIFDIFVYG